MDLNFQNSQDLFQFLFLGLLIICTLVLLIVVINIFYTLRVMVEEKQGIKKESFTLAALWNKLNSLKPLQEEEAILLDHNYDGIRELDNHLPPWWLGLFYGSIIFSVVYLLNYHVWETSPLQIQEYEIAMAEAKSEKAAKSSEGGLAQIDENNVSPLTDVAALDRGKLIYEGNCAVCHGGAGEGGVGPNLTDEFWLHGGSIGNVFNSIKYGIPDKGMIAWQATLKPEDMQNVSSYILKLQGTKPANAKAAQGEKYIPEADLEPVEEEKKELSVL